VTVFGYRGCPIPAAYFLSVNIPLIWVVAPIAALLSRRHPVIGLAFYGVIFVNLFFHIMPLLAGTGFGPGTLTALVLFVLFINGNLGSAALVGTQLANAVLFLVIPWVGENWWRGVLIRPVT